MNRRRADLTASKFRGLFEDADADADAEHGYRYQRHPPPSRGVVKAVNSS